MMLSDKKVELEILRENKVKGEQISSSIQWLSEGQKPLLKIPFIENTIQKLHNNNGQYIYDQKELLHQVKLYYTHLFKNWENNLNTET